METLTLTERRVLGCLLEKERTVPDTYPLTLKALVAACNQTTGRDPVLDLSPAEVTDALGALRERSLIRRVYPSHGARAEKYRQVADEAWGLGDDERAVVTLLLLRGPQTVGELRSHSGRLFGFGDIGAVHHVLDVLAGRNIPMVTQLEREPGRKEPRWTHLLTPDDEAPPAPSAAAAPRPAEPEIHAHPEVAHLAPLLGTWAGSGEGSYPTIDDFGYAQTVSFSPVPGKPLVAYRSATTAADDGRPLHGESGFLRPVGTDGAELVAAQGSGVVEAAEGVVETTASGLVVMLSSTSVTGTATAKSVTATEREYQVNGDELTYRIAMAAVGQPLTHHLHATLHRQ